MYLVDNLKFLKMRHGVNNAELGKATGVKYFANYSSGRNVPPLEVIIKLASYFKISLDELVLHDLKNEYIFDKTDISMVSEHSSVYGKKTLIERMKLIELELEEIRKEMKKN